VVTATQSSLFETYAKEKSNEVTKNLEFLNEFVVGFGRAANLKTGNLIGSKIHDYHKIME
jgi:hypothetical protein